MTLEISNSQGIMLEIGDPSSKVLKVLNMGVGEPARARTMLMCVQTMGGVRCEGGYCFHLRVNGASQSPNPRM